MVSIERTDEWLTENFYNPIKICNQLDFPSDKETAAELYDYLVSFGMYKPNQRAQEVFVQLKKNDTWSKVEHIFTRYQRKWNGPNIPVYIFPMGRIRNANINDKAGISFENKMFLFLTPLKDDKEIEALIVHEYHHVCRMNNQTKALQDYTLLDSIVMEGLAEFAVKKYCGKNYNAKWTSYYTSEELKYYWKKYFVNNLSAKRSKKIHNVLLFGMGRFPDLLGYAVGYHMINNFETKKRITIKESFSLRTEEILSQSNLLD